MKKRHRIFTAVFLFPSALFSYIYPYQTPTAHYLKPVQITESHSNLEGVDCIFVINLDRRPERWERVKQMCETHGLKVNRFSAVDGWTLTDEAAKELIGPYKRSIEKGVIGCLLSHVSILQEAYDRNYDVIWVLEDDADFVGDVRDIPELLSRLSSIDPEWDVFYTNIDGKNRKGEYVPSCGADFRPDYVDHPPRLNYLQRTVVDNGIMRIGQRFCTDSLLISRRGIEKMLYHFTHSYIYSPIDVDMHYVHGIREYSVTKDLTTIRSERSDTTYYEP